METAVGIACLYAYFVLFSVMKASSDAPKDPPDAASATAAEGQHAERARSLAASLLEIGAVELSPTDPFKWSSGLVAPIYCDNRRTIAYPRVRRAIRDGFVDVLNAQALASITVAGTATAGIPHAAWLAEAVDRPMAYVRSSAKGHGQGERIEGVVGNGDEVVVLEDLISTGKSALDAVTALREAGAQVQAVLAIFSYELDVAAAAFRDADVPRFVLTTFSSLVDVAHERNSLTTDERGVLESWRNDPGGWSVQHGGRRPD